MANIFDFETRSAADLRKVGAHVYAAHPTTDALCLGYTLDDGPKKLWKLGDPPPNDLLDSLLEGEPMEAHNAQFDWLIWNFVCVKKYGWPALPIEQTYCTMTYAYAMGLPGALEHAAPAVGLEAKKDMAGNRVMMQLSQPRDVSADGKITWWEPNDPDPKVQEKFAKLYAYCLQDIEVQRQLRKRLMPLSAQEREIWLLDQKINNFGIAIDSKKVKAALALVEAEKKLLTEKLNQVTGGGVSSPQAVAQFKEWLEDFGLSVPSLAKADVTELLDEPALPPVCREALTIRQMAAKSSTSKLGPMLLRAGSDGRARGGFQYYGAQATGRWAARGIQMHNFPRNKFPQKTVVEIIELLGRVGA